MPVIRTLLVANRGEIARRVIRTARSMGIRTVAVYSEPRRRSAPRPRRRPLPSPLGGGPAPSPTSTPDRCSAAARASGADAVHPGYGFLSENAGFAAAAPRPAGVRRARPGVDRDDGAQGPGEGAARASAGVPVLPDALSPVTTRRSGGRGGRRRATRCWSRPTAGGGGRGMRLVDTRRRARRGRGRGPAGGGRVVRQPRVFCERYLAAARHVEIQVFGDAHGDAVHLGERECSMQRRHQKVLEEAPSPAVVPELRGRWARPRCRSCGRSATSAPAPSSTCSTTRRGELLLPRDEHPAPGRAPGDRGGDRPGPGPAPARGRAGPMPCGSPGGRRHPRPCDRGPALRRGPGARPPADPGPTAPIRHADDLPGSGSRTASPRPVRSRLLRPHAGEDRRPRTGPGRGGRTARRRPRRDRGARDDDQPGSTWWRSCASRPSWRARHGPDYLDHHPAPGRHGSDDLQVVHLAAAVAVTVAPPACHEPRRTADSARLPAAPGQPADQDHLDRDRPTAPRRRIPAGRRERGHRARADDRPGVARTPIRELGPERARVGVPRSWSTPAPSPATATARAG